MRSLRWIGVTALVAACGGSDGGGTPPAAVDHVTISPASPAAMTAFNQTVPLTAQALDASDNPIGNASISWTTSAPGTVSLSTASGASTTAKALGNGSSTITATAGGKQMQLQLTVAQAFAALGLNKSTMNLQVNATDQLQATLVDAGGSALTLGGLPTPSFSTNNATVADVNAASGLVTAKSIGTARITATVTFAGLTKTAFSDVTVAATQPQTVDVSTTAALTWSPTPVTIHTNDRVNFNVGAIHNLIFDAGNPAAQANVSSGAIPVGGAGQSALRTFTVAGTYNYHCGVHAGMDGMVIVQP